MEVKINAPKMRSLNPNEKLVRDMLKSKSPKKISEILHIPLKPNFENDESLSIMEIIASIREKGWEIKEEEKIMRGYPTPTEIKNLIIKLSNQGKSVNEIKSITKVPERTIRDIIKAPLSLSSVTKRLIFETLDKELINRAYELSDKKSIISEHESKLKALKEEYDYLLSEYELLYKESEEIK